MIRVVLEGLLRGKHLTTELCQREAIAPGLCNKWTKEFLEVGKNR